VSAARPSQAKPPAWALWKDRQGKTSILRIAALAAAIAPAAYVWFNAVESGAHGFFGLLASLIFHTGIVSLWLMLAALAVTPLRRLTGYGKLIGIRRILGVSAFAYAAAHLVTYLFLRQGSLDQMATELVSRVTIIVALVAFVMLMALFATSNDAAVRKLGGDRWAQLHKLVYWAVGLSVVHFVLSPGSYSGDPFLMGGLYFWLMGWRIQQRFLGNATEPLPLVGLAFVAAAVTTVFEFVSLMFFKVMTPDEIAGLNYSFTDSLPTPLVVLVLGLLAAAIPLVTLRSTSRNA